MKAILLIAALAGFSIYSPADTFRLEGAPFHPATNSEIVWSVQTNALPRGLWIYKVMPEAFSAAVVSNAMTIGHFQMKDLSKGDYPLLKDKHSIYFYNKNESNRPRFLFIAPTLGAMQYSSQRDYAAPVEDVPSSEKTEQLARDVLFQLGIDRSLLGDRVRNGYDETSNRYDRNRKQTAPAQAVLRGISFERRIDGIPMSDNWCFLIHFRSHGIVEDFSLKWRNILPFESRRVLGTNEITEAIKAGKTFLPTQLTDLTGLYQAKKLTVVKVTPRYYNGLKGEVLDFMYPYADLEMTAELGNSNTATFFLNCQILGERAP